MKKLWNTVGVIRVVLGYHGTRVNTLATGRWEPLGSPASQPSTLVLRNPYPGAGSSRVPRRYSGSGINGIIMVHCFPGPLSLQSQARRRLGPGSQKSARCVHTRGMPFPIARFFLRSSKTDCSDSQYLFAPTRIAQLTRRCAPVGRFCRGGT